MPVSSAVQKIERFLSELRDTIWQYFNQFLVQLGYTQIRPDRPIPEQLTIIGEFERRLAAVRRSAEYDKQRIKDALTGLIRVVSGDNSFQITDDYPTIKSLADSIASGLTYFYSFAAQFPGGLQLINYINPHSSVALSASLSDLFSRIPISASPEQIADLADMVAISIISDPQKHKGFTPVEIAEAVTHSIREGLIEGTTILDPDVFMDRVSSVLKMIAPVRYYVYLTGEQDNISIKDMISFAKNFQAQFPYATKEEYEESLWLLAEYARVDGLVKAITTYSLPSMRHVFSVVQKEIRESQMTVKELSDLHDKLTKAAVNSYLGSMIGTLIYATRSGFVPRNSPAYFLYMKAINGEPLPIIHPHQIALALANSGVAPQFIAVMMASPDVARMYLTPLAAMSARLTQWSVDWLPRYMVIQNMFPGNDRYSIEMKRTLMRQLAAMAGLKPGAIFSVLSPEFAYAAAAMTKTLRAAGRRKAEMAGYESITAMPGLGRIFAELGAIGRGEKPTESAWRDLLRIFGKALGIVESPGPPQQLFYKPDQIPSSPITSTLTETDNQFIENVQREVETQPVEKIPEKISEQRR